MFLCVPVRVGMLHFLCRDTTHIPMRVDVTWKDLQIINNLIESKRKNVDRGVGGKEAKIQFVRCLMLELCHNSCYHKYCVRMILLLICCSVCWHSEGHLVSGASAS